MNANFVQTEVYFQLLLNQLSRDILFMYFACLLTVCGNSKMDCYSSNQVAFLILTRIMTCVQFVTQQFTR
ncbi:MAG: hypothetical protein KDD45_18165, partial [Bdellovibrionales bacterium]|nr:hypothetical protein [Bdellovibrionales bacterium]